MFETEAGFAETKMLINCKGDYSKKQDYKKGWQDGAEFGYNKANEWHYPSKGEYPKKDSEVLIEYGDNNTHIVVDWINNTKMFGGFCVDEVKRWKEIVL